LISIFALELLWVSHMSIQMMAMSDLGDALMTRGLAASEISLNRLLFF